MIILCVETLHGAPIVLQNGEEKVRCERNTLEELNIAGTLAEEPSWIESFRAETDLHSINAAIIFGFDWVEATEEDCAFYKSKNKCNCVEHKRMRNAAKTIEFGYMYGMQGPSMAAKLKISVKEANNLLKAFTSRLKNLSSYMYKVQSYAVKYGNIVEPVLGRIRFFDDWKLIVGEELAGIERQAGNFTIQAAGSGILKIFAVLFYRWIIANGLEDRVKLLLLVHDECLVEVMDNPDGSKDEKLVENTRVVVENTMMLAAKLGGFPLLRASAGVGDTWAEIH